MTDEKKDDLERAIFHLKRKIEFNERLKCYRAIRPLPPRFPLFLEVRWPSQKWSAYGYCCQRRIRRWFNQILARMLSCLYEYFASYASFVNQKQKRQAEDWARIQILKKEFHEAKNKLAKATKQMSMTIDYSFEQWKANGIQLIIEFE